MFAVSMFDDFEKYAKVPEEWMPPEHKPYEARVSSALLQASQAQKALSLAKGMQELLLSPEPNSILPFNVHHLNNLLFL